METLTPQRASDLLGLMSRTVKRLEGWHERMDDTAEAIKVELLRLEAPPRQQDDRVRSSPSPIPPPLANAVMDKTGIQLVVQLDLSPKLARLLAALAAGTPDAQGLVGFRPLGDLAARLGLTRHGLSQAIYRLRAALGRCGLDPRLIEVRRGEARLRVKSNSIA